MDFNPLTERCRYCKGKRQSKCSAEQMKSRLYISDGGEIRCKLLDDTKDGYLMLK
jgi:hypothetical protein